MGIKGKYTLLLKKGKELSRTIMGHEITKDIFGMIVIPIVLLGIGTYLMLKIIIWIFIG